MTSHETMMLAKKLHDLQKINPKITHFMGVNEDVYFWLDGEFQVNYCIHYEKNCEVWQGRKEINLGISIHCPSLAATHHNCDYITQADFDEVEIAIILSALYKKSNTYTLLEDLGFADISNIKIDHNDPASKQEFLKLYFNSPKNKIMGYRLFKASFKKSTFLHRCNRVLAKKDQS